MVKELEIRIKQLEQRIDILSDQLNKALNYIEDDPHSSLTKSRTILEQILLNIYKLEMTQEPKRIELGAILTDNQFTRKIDKRIISRMNAIRDMSNLGVHGEKVVSKDAKIVLDNLCEVLEWYFENYITVKSEKKNINSPIENTRKPIRKIIFLISGILIVILVMAIPLFIIPLIQKPGKTSSIKQTNFSPIKGKDYALIIGINEYSDSQIVDLKKPIKTAEDFSNLLTSKYTFDIADIKFLKNAKYIQIMEAFDYFVNKLRPIDNFLIFYYGNSFKDQSSGSGFWLPSDASQISRSNWISNSVLRDYVSMLKAKHILLISDGCLRSVIFTKNTPDDKPIDLISLNERNSRRAIIGNNLEVNPDQSEFFKYFINSLSYNTEKNLTDKALFEKIPKLINKGNSTPMFGLFMNCGDEGGGFIFTLK